MFLEDGVEVGNVFRGNLAVFVRTSSSLLNEDVTPAAFWVNPLKRLKFASYFFSFRSLIQTILLKIML